MLHIDYMLVRWLVTYHNETTVTLAIKLTSAPQLMSRRATFSLP